MAWLTSTLLGMDWTRTITTCLLLGGALVLAYQPLLWLLGSWYLPGYPRSGPLVFGLVLALFGYSLSSPKIRQGGYLEQRRLLGFGLLLLSASIRALAQVGDVNLLGALVLAVDVYAIALLLGTGVRERAVAPFWLAVVFCFCLPLEPWLQRLLGTPLQWLSAQGACGLLSLTVDDLVCDGVRLSLQGVEVLVDLACSGSTLLVQASLLLALLCACTAPTWVRILVGAMLTAFVVWLLNALRISLLALGLAYQPWGLDVMEPKVHAAIGLLCFALLAIVLLVWAPRRRVRHGLLALEGATIANPPPQPRRWSSLAVALAFMLLVLVIVQLDASPLDRTLTVTPPYAPAVLAGQPRRAAALTQQEQNYYQTYGGAALKASYGTNGLLLVRTGAPIRHLHAPDLCLGGMGFDVEMMGTDLTSVPTAVYRAQRRNSDEVWQVRVSYVSDNGSVTASLSEVAWQWLKSPGTGWTMVQRLVPWHSESYSQSYLQTASKPAVVAGEPASRLIPVGAAAWDQAVLRAFNLYTPAKPTANPTPNSQHSSAHPSTNKKLH